MENSDLRNPIQKRAIEKKEKILEYGFKLICDKGYHNVDAIQIAKYSGVSTGTVYQYFTDKRDIFLQGLEKYSKNMMFPINNLIDKKIDKNNLHQELKKIITSIIKTHTMSKTAHEEITAMQHTDNDVAEIFNKYELETSSILVTILNSNNFSTDFIEEKAHLILRWIDDLCHEIVFHKHKNIDYDKMIDLVIISIENLLV